MLVIPEHISFLLMSYLLIFWQFFKNWWWILPPFLLWKNFLYYYLYWRIEKWDATQPRILLEVKIPEQIVKPIKAMEQVFAGFHAMHDVFNWREKWLEGQYQLKFSLEIVSTEGKIHFFIRTPKKFRSIIESNIYAQYPEVEITEVSDYTLNVPQDIPNKEWDLWGADQINTKPDPYPIKTYTEFESGHEAIEEKRIDPLSNLIEGMATLGKGEHLWLQIVAKPVREQDKDWVGEGLKIRDELIRRSTEKKQKSILLEILDILIFGAQKSSEKKEESIPPEMKLTSGEKELVSAIERKITKFGFDCNIRYVYIGKRDSYFGPRPRLVYSFFKALSYENLGGFKPNKRTITKSKSVFLWFLDKRILYLKKRRIFRFYKSRLSPYFPNPGGTYVLNTEELATLYHFPSKIVAPTSALPRIETKKEAPPELPIG